MAQVGVVADAVDAGARREGRVHQDHGGAELGQMVPDGFRVVACHCRTGKEPGEERGAGGGDLVEMQGAGGLVPEGAVRHHGQHAGACRGFEHDVAGPDRGGLEGGVGQRQRRRELLQPELLFGAPRLGGLQRRQGLQHAQHGAGPVRSRPGLAPHGAAVALEEQDQRRLGRLVGVLPDPGAVGVARTEGAGHRVAQHAGIEGAAGLQDGEQGPGGGQQRGRFRRDGRPGSDRRGCGGMRVRRRRAGARARPAPDGRRAWAGSGHRGVRRAATGRRGAVAPSPLRPACPAAATRAPGGVARGADGDAGTSGGRAFGPGRRVSGGRGRAG